MKALAKLVVVGRPVRRSFGGGGASFWICVLLLMCNLLLCPFGSNVGAELSRDGLLLLNFSSTNNLHNRLGQCQGDIGTWTASDNTPCGWLRVFCNAESAVHRLDFSGCDMSSALNLHPLDELGSLQELDFSSNPSFRGGGGGLGLLTQFTGLTWLDISGSVSAGDLLGNAPTTTLGSLRYLYAKGMPPSLKGSLQGLGGLRELVVLSCASSNLAGSIDEELSNLTKLVSLDLSSNSHWGSVPNLEGLTRLTQLSLSSNYFLTGDVPSAPRLQYLDAGVNNFTNLTDAFFQMSDLRRLDLSRNQLGGQIPVIKGLNFPRLEVLDLSSNILRGPIPSTLPHVKYLDLSNNKLSGPIPPEFQLVIGNEEGVDRVAWLDLSGNELNGTIPASSLYPTGRVGGTNPVNCYVNLSGNSLVGSIPEYPFQLDAYGPLTPYTLDLSDNQLSGPLPSSFTNSSSDVGFGIFWLQNNQISGSIPLGLPEAVYRASAFADNPGLCGGPLEPCITPQPPVQRGFVIKVWVLVIIVVAVVLVCTGSCLLLLWKWKVYSKKHQQDAELIATLLERETVTVMPLRELQKATSNFSESAQIGVGGFGTVYVGKLANGTAVAIKKGKREGSPQYKQQFLNEVRILSGVNHRHLVKLLGCSMENKIALLVFEFVPNGTLQEHLRGKRPGPGFSPLSWRQRLLIALQTCDALAYLHSAADPPIIHRDVKSSNILLDNDLNAKVADFGISKLAPSSAATHVSTVAVQGTMGYIDPEYYVSSRLTPRSDVYSFGVVLLELISAKPAVDFRGGEDDEASLVILAFSARDRGEWEGLIDPMLADTYSLDHGKVSIESVGTLATRCLALKSRERPDMKEVWKVLQTVWLDWDSDTSVQPDDGQHDVQPLLLPNSDGSDSYDSMSLQSSQASLQSTSTTSGPQIEMQHPRFQTL